MTDLTEQWKKGELPEGEKYIQLRDGRIFTAYFNGKEFREVYNIDIKEVLAPVPSYKEYQKLLSDQLAKIEGEEINAELETRLKKTQELELELRKENAQLKEYERIVAGYYMKPIDYETACETVNKLLDEKKAFKEENAQLKELLKECRECVDENLEFSKSIGRNRIQPRNKGLLKRIDEALQ